MVGSARLALRACRSKVSFRVRQGREKWLRAICQKYNGRVSYCIALVAESICILCPASCPPSPSPLFTKTTHYPGCLLSLKQSHLQHNCRPGPPCRKQTTRWYVDEWHGREPDPECLVSRVDLETGQPTSGPAQCCHPPPSLEALRRDIACNRLRPAHGSKCALCDCASCNSFLYIFFGTYLALTLLAPPPSSPWLLLFSYHALVKSSLVSRLLVN